ncbi:MAG: DUF58 domain-containing protein [Gemmatimonadetes bacterium]|nr:DUF58 domain-containing protein [Gemmatimonadota bacterium]NIQ56924.1 DUF58 domain-containing protein [Gemmatimonadota bacterium]NIU77098.1 DUF58 domain-containing protein [Gammaproteobacteria bacterium]NIX45927.1 DUF58 domain-containing protein [Gemmatimonadota bacterium]NIY10248.1 DUF58 domain-containing protein [Gemmatimonadota bacterium]
MASRIVEGLLSGLHRSPHRGFSVEFAEHRAYQPGDDLRFVDWRMFGRSDRYYVKQFEEETNLRCTLLLDLSASMDWSSDERGGLPSKLWYAKQLTASLALLLVRQGDAVGLTAFDEEVRLRIPAGGGRAHWHQLVQAVEALPAGGRTETIGPLRDAASRMRRRGLVILISDLLVDGEETRLALRMLRHRGHEVIVFHLMDPGELELPSVRAARFVDPETGEELPASAAELREEYRRAVDRALAEWRDGLAAEGMDHYLVETDRPMALVLRHYLTRRASLG